MEKETKENLQQEVQQAERQYKQIMNEYAADPEKANEFEPRLQRLRDVIIEAQKKLKSL